jgi:hypothetical protein
MPPEIVPAPAVFDVLRGGIRFETSRLHPAKRVAVLGKIKSEMFK